MSSSSRSESGSKSGGGGEVCAGVAAGRGSEGLGPLRILEGRGSVGDEQRLVNVQADGGSLSSSLLSRLPRRRIGCSSRSSGSVSQKVGLSSSLTGSGSKAGTSSRRIGGGGEHANVASEFKLGCRKNYIILEGGSAGEGGIGCRPGVEALVRAGRGILILELNPAGVVMGCGGG